MSTMATPRGNPRRLARSIGRAFLIAAEAAGILLLAGIGYLWIVILAALLIPEPENTQAPELRHQWTTDGRWVEHQNTHDGRGFVPTSRSKE